MRRSRPTVLVLLAALTACGSPGPLGVVPRAPAQRATSLDIAAEPRPERAHRQVLGRDDLAGWDRLPAERFEALALAALPADGPHPLDEFVSAELEGALARPGPRAVRAAVLLGRARSRGAAEALLRQLERRVPHPGRAEDAADVVAAGALERLPDGAWAADRLVALGRGPGAHPDLEVRVACAVAALQHGRDDVVPFLLAVLRIGTPDGSDDVRDFPVSDTTTWARAEAAAALARRAGVPDRYPADGPLRARDRVALELERRLSPPASSGR